MPRNFLGSYSGCVGFTALIDTLKSLPGFRVLLFEELDFYSLQNTRLLEFYNNSDLHKYVDHICRVSAKLNMSVGFKWRMWAKSCVE